MTGVMDPSFIDPRLDARAVTFENPSGERGAGGTAAAGRKGAPSRRVTPGERVVLADLEGPGTVRHLWLTVPPAPPEQTRALALEVFYDGAAEPSVSVPLVDFFGLPHGRPVHYHSALTSCPEGRGFNSYLPMPFDERVRIEMTNHGAVDSVLYFQVDYTLEPATDRSRSYLHVAFRRQNPTILKDDFVIVDGLEGPGRFLGCNVGVRVLDGGIWYGEGEVKIYRDGDGDLPTICGTGLEDYVGSAWGMGRFDGPYAGAPLIVGPPGTVTGPDTLPSGQPAFVGFYRWHLPDPVMFERDLKVTIQQIGAAFFLQGQDEDFEAFDREHEMAGTGWAHPEGPVLASGIFERVDDYCATAYVYCREPQAVPRLDVASAVADLRRLPFESANPYEILGPTAVAENA